MIQKLSNILFWGIIYGIFGLSIHWTLELIIYSLLNQSLYYIIFTIPSLITLFGFESYSVFYITTMMVNNNKKLKN